MSLKRNTFKPNRRQVLAGAAAASRRDQLREGC